jgi:dCTP deaminase
MPDDVIAICVGKSTYARLGLFVNITPLEAGWRGQLTIELTNSASLPVRVYAGMGIAQLLFFEGERPKVTYADRKGKYQDQTGVTLPRL